MPSPTTHATLSASGAHRWLHCTPSALLEAGLPDTTSQAAEQGTAAHALAEHKLRKLLKQRSTRPTSPYNDDEMETHTDAYAAYVWDAYSQAKQADPNTQLLLEHRVDFSNWVPGGYGTCDCIIASDQQLTIIDFKYGAGVLVDAINNPQMRLYALGAMDELSYIYGFEHITTIIYQPRRDNISTDTFTVTELVEWADGKVRPKAQLANQGEGDYQAGEWCGFCKLKHTCRARAEANLEIAKHEFKPPAELTDDEITECLTLLPQVKKWCADLEAYTLAQAVDKGKQWGGFKLVEGRSIRKFVDPDEAAKAAIAAGYEDIYDRKLITLSAMEKLMGKKTFAHVMGDLVHKPAGKLQLAPESDKRPAVVTRTPEQEFLD